jgi:hypothetical protein
MVTGIATEHRHRDPRGALIRLRTTSDECRQCEPAWPNPDRNYRLSELLIPSNETERVPAYSSPVPCCELLEIALAIFDDSLYVFINYKQEVAMKYWH